MWDRFSWKRLTALVFAALLLGGVPEPSSFAFAAEANGGGAPKDAGRAPGGQGPAAAAAPATAAAGSAAAAGATAAGRSQPPAAVSWSELQRRYRGVFVLRAPASGGRRVALTFDDVPDPRYTPLVLNTLQRKRVRATFFVVGSRARKHPALVARIVREGHAVGNHTYSHPELPKLRLADVKREIERTGATIRHVAGFEPAMIRPPYGDIGPAQLEWAKSQGYTVVNWDVDSSDWRQLPASVVLRNATRGVRPGSIILMHAGGGAGQNLYGTVKALPLLIDRLRAQGYELVTVPELLHRPEQRRGGGRAG